MKLRKWAGILTAACCLVSGCQSAKTDPPKSEDPVKPAAVAEKVKPRRDLQAVKQAIRQGEPCSLYFADLESGTVFTRAPRKMPSASMIKVFILAKAYAAMEQGTLRRDEVFTISRDNVVGGSGYLQGMAYGTRVSLSKVLHAMITASDNTATNIMIDRLGMKAINDYMQANGYKDSLLQRKMMDYDAIAAGRDNYTSVTDVGRLFERLGHGTCVNPEMDREMLEIYKEQEDRDILPANLPSGTVVAHKTGEVNDVRHDGGIVYTPDGAYVLCIFSERYCPYRTMAAISEDVYSAYRESGKSQPLAVVPKGEIK